jgi:formylglycine-generating enzyme required for sulfatase activity
MMEQKTVFISYRRATSKHLARSIYQDLKANGWDVFLDVDSIDSGDFDKIILNQIGARAHFILLISSDSLVRCSNQGDWVLREIQEAVRLERNIVPIIEQGADIAREMGYLPADLRAIVNKKNALDLPHSYFEEGMHKLRIRFLKTPEYINLKTPPSAERAEVQRRMNILEHLPLISELPTLQMPKWEQDIVPKPSDPTSLKLMGAFFGWIEIPPKYPFTGIRFTPSYPLTDIEFSPKAHSITKNRLSDIEFPPKAHSITENLFTNIKPLREGFSIAKYPITNTDFAKFIEADGYNQKKWWTDAGWKAKLKGWDWNSKKSKWVETNKAWTQPLYWTDTTWNGVFQPVVGVSWYESVAFCLWLSDITGEKIMLPTENQWQYAAQGDDGRKYPWGTRWAISRCNNNVGNKGIGKTTSVSAYQGKGNSPFGVVDMAGNIWEWCLTDYETNTNNSNKDANYRTLRGGSWHNNNTDDFGCDFHAWRNPYVRSNEFGFRISRS